MDRKQLIERLVSRKLANKGQDKVFCVCIAMRNPSTGGRRTPKR